MLTIPFEIAHQTPVCEVQVTLFSAQTIKTTVLTRSRVVILRVAKTSVITTLFAVMIPIFFSIGELLSPEKTTPFYGVSLEILLVYASTILDTPKLRSTALVRTA